MEFASWAIKNLSLRTMNAVGSSSNAGATHRFAPVLMAIGVTMLLGQICWAALPVATSVSLVALGATVAAIARRGGGSHRVALAVHLCIYTCLYSLFVGAICDLATRGASNGLSMSRTIDLGASAGVMVFVAQLCIASIFGGEDAPAR
jgi:hypothetical protein